MSEQAKEWLKGLGMQEELGKALLDYFSGDYKDSKKALDDHYQGIYMSERDFAEQMTVDIGDVPEHLAFYIDYDLMARDLFINDYFSIHVGFQTHVFRQF